jgi:hypothetical protein
MGWSELSDGEKLDIGLVYGGAFILGIGSIVFRVQTVGSLSADLLRTQYALSFIFLGSLLLLKIRARTPSGNIMTAGLSVAMLLGVVFPVPGIAIIDVISYGLLAMVVFVGGMLHYRFNQPTNFHAIALAGIMGTEMCIFGLAYTLISFSDRGAIPFLLAAVLLIIVYIGFMRILSRELSRSYSNSLDWFANWA